MPTDTRAHRKLESEVVEFARELGYLHGSMTYHEAMPVDLGQRLAKIDTLAALAVRNHADKTFVHARYNSVFLLEAKTRNSRDGHDAFFEATQLMANLYRTAAGAKILYVFRNEHLDLDVGFWSSEISRLDVEKIHWPPRWRGNEVVMKKMKDFFRNALPIHVGRSRGGSDDPYVIIEYDFLESCPNWRDLIQAEHDQYLED